MSLAESASVAPLWHKQLMRNKSGLPIGHEANVFVALERAPELVNILEYNEFADAILLKHNLPNMGSSDDKLFLDGPGGVWTDEHVTWLIRWLIESGFGHLRRAVVQDVAVAVAKKAAFHPVRAYLEECRAAWDAVPRIDTWLARYLGGRNPQEYLAAVGPKFLIGAVARIMQPGCQMDSMLVLEGGQGTGKSTAVHILGHGWSRDVTGDLGGKDAAIHIQGVWIGEMSELSSIRRSDQEAIKGFVSRRIDHYRPPYGRNALDRPRHSVFIATTNESEYLQDPTGARRFWPVECSTIDLAALAADAAQLWGEACARYKLGEPWHLKGVETRAATREQSYRQRLTPLDTVVLEYADAEREAGHTQIEMGALLREAFGIEPHKEPGKAGAIGAHASRALICDGWLKLNPTGRGQKRRLLYRWPEAAPEQLMSGNGATNHETHKQAQADELMSEKSSSQAHKLSQAESAYDDDIPF